MALVNLATLWPVKKVGGKLVMAGDSKDGSHTYMLFKKHSKDGKYVMYDLCEKVEDKQSEEPSSGDDESPVDEEDLPF